MCSYYYYCCCCFVFVVIIVVITVTDAGYQLNFISTDCEVTSAQSSKEVSEEEKGGVTTDESTEETTEGRSKKDEIASLKRESMSLWCFLVTWL